jgi:outer membrane immunogenic protein
MKNTILKGAGALCMAAAIAISAAPAFAADMSRTADGGYKDGPMPVGWAGLYFGGHVGAAWGDINFQDSYIPLPSDIWNSSSVKTSGLTGGGQLGFNLQSGSLVYGIEADLGGLDISGSKALRDSSNFQHTFSNSGGFYGDITGRLGFTSGATLFYAKGGAAFLNDTFKGSYYSGTYNFSNSATLWGWTAGGGVEHMLRPGWSLKAEYQHFDFGEKTFNTFTNWQLRYAPGADTLTLGLNYHVGREYEALK